MAVPAGDDFAKKKKEGERGRGKNVFFRSIVVKMDSEGVGRIREFPTLFAVYLA